MAEEKQPKLEQRLTQQTKRRIKKYLIEDYVGKNIVMEIGDIGYGVSYGHLDSFDGGFLRISGYKNTSVTLENAITHGLVSYNDITSEQNIIYTLPSRTINVNLIASIQTLEEVLGVRKE